MQTIIPLGPKYEDSRGAIQMLIEDARFNSCSIITSKPNTSRARHFHYLDSHICFVKSGSICYYERQVGSKEKPKLTIIQAGELFYTPPLFEHEMFFPVVTEFICFSELSRKNENYEQDTVKLEYSLKEIYDAGQL